MMKHSCDRRAFLTRTSASLTATVILPGRFAVSSYSYVPRAPQGPGVRVLAFDVGGTVFDWHRTVRDELATLAKRKGLSVDAAAFTNEWRRGMFTTLTRVRSGELRFMNIDEIHRLVLDDLLAKHGMAGVTDVERHELVRAWHRIKPWPDVRSGLARLRKQFTVSGFSILSFALLVDASKAADLQWDAIISCEFLGVYKPDPRAYQKAADLLGVQPQHIMMVAAHPGDLRGARNVGFRTALVVRPAEFGDNETRPLLAGTEFDLATKDFNELADRLLQQ